MTDFLDGVWKFAKEALVILVAFAIVLWVFWALFSTIGVFQLGWDRFVLNFQGWIG